MEDNTKLIEELFEKAVDFGKTSYDLARLKALDKSSDVASSLVPYSIAFVLLASFMLFVNFGIAFWLGKILGNTYLGFFVIAGFYMVSGLVFHFFFHKSVKNRVWSYIIKQVLK